MCGRCERMLSVPPGSVQFPLVFGWIGSDTLQFPGIYASGRQPSPYESEEEFFWSVDQMRAALDEEAVASRNATKPRRNGHFGFNV